VTLPDGIASGIEHRSARVGARKAFHRGGISLGVQCRERRGQGFGRRTRASHKGPPHWIGQRAQPGKSFPGRSTPRAGSLGHSTRPTPAVSPVPGWRANRCSRSRSGDRDETGADMPVAGLSCDDRSEQFGPSVLVRHEHVLTRSLRDHLDPPQIKRGTRPLRNHEVGRVTRNGTLFVPVPRVVRQKQRAPGLGYEEDRTVEPGDLWS
jgi:hypothetical protein